jgi:arylsulfatase A-like enzyme
MTPSITRRDFLKAGSLLPLGLAVPGVLRTLSRPAAAGDTRQNVLVIIFDAWSAYHVPFNGYARQTTPNLSQLLDRAIVYHNHYAPADFTSPGTASLLTGTMPWTHRAFDLHGQVKDGLVRQNIFRAFGDYHRVAYSHNPAANTLLRQFHPDLDDLVPQNELFLTANPFTYSLFARDEEIADVGWSRALSQEDQGYSYSLFLSKVHGVLVDRQLAAHRQGFPLGVPRLETGAPFLLEEATDWLQVQTERMPQPYMGYFHFLPPHNPSAPPADLHRAFVGDGYQAPIKPLDVFAEDLSDAQAYAIMRRQYDEFILYVDREFGRLYDYLDANGTLENTWIVLTSDHGELFERGVRGHSTPILYEPLIRVPLVIFEPGRRTRTDVHSLTSAIDLLPTLLHVTAHDPAPWAEGVVLPPFAEPPARRTIHAVHTRRNKPAKPLQHATVALVNDEYKLLYFFGYPELGQGVERVELYDLKADPEELHDLYSERGDVAHELLAALKATLAEVNAAYM